MIVALEVCSSKLTTVEPGTHFMPNKYYNTETVCDNSCVFANDGTCDDGGRGAKFSGCPTGTDCNDCGLRVSDQGISASSVSSVCQ